MAFDWCPPLSNMSVKSYGLLWSEKVVNKKSLNFWINNKSVNKIIFIENSGSDVSYFRNLAKSENNKEIEILSTNSNNSYDKNLGKGYGQYLCLKEVFESSKIAQKTGYFIDVTGRYCIKNFIMNWI